MFLGNTPVSGEPRAAVASPVVFLRRQTAGRIAKVVWLLPLLLVLSCGTTAIAPSSNLTGTASKYSVQLKWDPPGGSDPAASYTVYRKVTGGSAGFAQINAAPVFEASYIDKAVQLGTTYTYEVSAVDANGGESAPSRVATVTVPSN